MKFIGQNTITQGNCLELLPFVKSHSVDMILCDLPYGVSEMGWDCQIPLSDLWRQYRRILIPTGAVVLTSTQPFTTTLINSNIDWFKYCWVWVKNKCTNFAHAKNKPMRRHEDICVFSPGTTVHANQSKRRMVYNPQGLIGMSSQRVPKVDLERPCFGERHSRHSYVRDVTRYPDTVLQCAIERTRFHPTQKPVALFEYLIRTYTNKGGLVLDNCCGSGTTGVACQNSGRCFIEFELDARYCDIARSRVSLKVENPELLTKGWVSPWE